MEKKKNKYDNTLKVHGTFEDALKVLATHKVKRKKRKKK